MALLFFDGFDAQDHALKWVSNLSVAPSYAEVTRYAMGSAFKPGVGSSGRLQKAIPATAQLFVGFAFKVDNITATRILLSAWGDTGVTQHSVLQVSTTGQVQALRGSSILASSAAGAIVPGNWNYIEMRSTIADSGGVFEVRLNGTQVINFTGDTKNVGTLTTYDMVSLSGASTTDPLITYDDLYIADALGSAPNNTFLGEVVVQTLIPTAPGNSTGFTPIGAATNWEAVGELPIDTNDYVASNVVGTKDTYTLANLSGSTGTIYGVQTNVIASKTGVGAANLKAVVRSGGTDYNDATVTLNASPAWYGAIRETNPNTGTAWTATTVNALEVGSEVA